MSCPYNSPRNGKAERIFHTINNMLCSLLFQASIPTPYWVEGLHTATYLLNHLPTKAISMTSPYFALYGVTPSYDQSTRCIFLGYSANHKGYRCLDLTTNNIIVSQHIVFDETDFPFSASAHLTNDLDILLQDDSPRVAHMPAPLPTPHVPPGFPPLTAAGGQTARETEAGGPTMSPGSQTAHRTGAGGSTASPGG
jgi:hypothetical protein